MHIWSATPAAARAMPSDEHWWHRLEPHRPPRSHAFADFFGRSAQIITHFQSINENPKPGIVPALSGTATWQSSLDSSRVWMVRVNGIDPDPNVDSCRNVGSIQCLLLQSVGNKKGPTGGNLLAETTFIQRLNTSGGAAPTSACTVGQTQLQHYTADYYFFRVDEQTTQSAANEWDVTREVAQSSCSSRARPVALEFIWNFLTRH